VATVAILMSIFMGLRGQLLNRMLSQNVGWHFSGVGFSTGVVLGALLVVAALWTLYWKYKALWYAAKHEHKTWFIALLVVNTLGILEILYLHVFSKYHKS